MNAVRKNAWGRINEYPCVKVALPVRDGLEFVGIEKIIRAEANRSYANFYLIDGTRILVSRPLSDFEEMLNDCGFLRVHRSHLINLNYIRKFVKTKKNYLIMDDGSEVEVSPFKREELYSRVALPLGK